MISEEAIERDLDVVDLAAVEMDEQRAVGGQAAKRRLDARHEEALEVGERISIGATLHLLDVVSTTAEARASPLSVGRRHADPVALLNAAGVERGVDVDEAGEPRGERRQHLRVVPEENLPHARARPQPGTAFTAGLA
jgi:hypothetical protein